MAICNKCGAQIQDGLQFCPYCGANVAENAAPPQPYPAPAPQYGDAPAPQQPYQAPAPQQQPYQTPPQQQQPYQTPPPAYSQQGQPYQQSAPYNDAAANKGMAVLAYLIFFVPLIAGTYKTSPFVKYHTNQGIILVIFSVAWAIVISIINAILSAIFLNLYLWAVWGIVSIVVTLLGFIPLAFVIIGILNAVNGRTNPLPVIGSMFTILK